ncbi:glycosyltransferase family 4 protein [uncultured Croceitalea sp.]|uniref:glycosyltransferase family 4 protein n=1 Tax=uncultured Croceitalea sp. TaxID=1798908 RepID=UPI00374E5E8B
MSKKKIAFVIGSLSAGGAERVITTLSNKLIDNYEIFIISLIKKTPFYQIDSRVNLKYCLENDITSKNFLESLLLNIKLVFKIKKILRNNNVDMAIGFITMANILTVIASKMVGIPCIISERNNPELEKTHFFWRFLRRLTYPRADILTVQTEGIKKFYTNFIKKNKIVTVPNPISDELSNNRNLNCKKENIILNVGRLHKQKNQLTLIKAFAKIHYGNWKLILLGEGEDRPKILKLIKNLNITDNVILLGKQPDIAKYYNSSKIFAFTSLYEGFPNALIEAMHFGLACISYDCPTGPSELIENNHNGKLIRLNDEKALVKGLQELIYNKKLLRKLGENAILTTNKYRIESVLVEWKTVFEKLLK